MPRQADLRRVIVIQTAFLGDVLLAFPLLKAIKEAGAEYILAVTKPETAEAMREVSEVDDVVSLEKQGSHQGLRATWNAGKELREHEFSSAIIPHRSFRSGLLAFATGAPVRIGFQQSAGRAFLTHAVRHHTAWSEVRRNDLLMQPFHCSFAYTTATGFVMPRVMPDTPSMRILIAPGSQWNTKCWPAERYRLLISLCVAAGWRVVVAGSERERKLCADVCEPFDAHGVENISGATSWSAYLDYVSTATVVVANDTAAVHAANAVGTPVVGIFGPTVPEFGFAPRGLLDRTMETHGLVCRPCSAHGGEYCPLGTHKCMTDISVDQVFQAVQHIARHRNERS